MTEAQCLELIGAITTGIGHFGSNYSASSAGRKWLMGGMGAAILSGLAWTIATTCVCTRVRFRVPEARAVWRLCSFTTRA